MRLEHAYAADRKITEDPSLANKLYFSRRDIRNLFGISRSTVIRMERRGVIRRVDFGLSRSPRYLKESVLSLVKSAPSVTPEAVMEQPTT